MPEIFWVSTLELKSLEFNLSGQHPECVAAHVQNVSGKTFMISNSQDAFKGCFDFCLFHFQDTFCSPQVALGDAATEQIADITAKACGEVGTLRG